MLLNTYIIDDEQPAINLIKSFIKKIPFLNLVGTETNALTALQVLQSEKIDLLFLDIQMPDITGIEFLQSLEKWPMVIFTTAFNQYAIQSYELDVVDYLLKPIPFQRFLKATNKALKLQKMKGAFVLKEQYLYIKVNYQTIKIAFEDILYVEGLKDYVKVYTKDKMYLTRLNLKGIQAKLPTEEFIRIHRSYIVAFSKISSFQKNKVKIKEKEISISEQHKENFFRNIG